jgi:hypothetical protein
MVWGGVILALLVAVAAVVVVVRLTAIPPAGTLVIDAAPWGTVAAIETQKGERLPLPSLASTPLSISVPSGTYQVTVTGPPPESQTQRITVRVDPNGSNVAPLVRFQAMTPEGYFEQYLTASTPAEPVPAPENAAASEAQPQVQPATVQSPAPPGANP